MGKVYNKKSLEAKLNSLTKEEIVRLFLLIHHDCIDINKFDDKLCILKVQIFQEQLSVLTKESSDYLSAFRKVHKKITSLTARGVYTEEEMNKLYEQRKMLLEKHEEIESKIVELEKETQKYVKGGLK